jgi:predicted homoserine dehydrogenase-like protein
VAKKDLKVGELLDGEGGYTVVGRLMPAADSLNLGCLPLGLAHGWKVLKAVPQGSPLKWSDVAFDANSTAVRLRREMEAGAAALERRRGIDHAVGAK